MLLQIKAELESEISGRCSHSILTWTCFILYPGVYPPTGLIAQRINVYRGMGSYKPAAGKTDEADGDAKVSNAAQWFWFLLSLILIKMKERNDSPLEASQFSSSECEMVRRVLIVLIYLPVQFKWTGKTIRQLLCCVLIKMPIKGTYGLLWFTPCDTKLKHNRIINMLMIIYVCAKRFLPFQIAIKL